MRNTPTCLKPCLKRIYILFVQSLFINPLLDRTTTFIEINAVTKGSLVDLEYNMGTNKSKRFRCTNKGELNVKSYLLLIAFMRH